MVIIHRLLAAFLLILAPSMVAMNPDEKKRAEEKPSYTLTAQDLDVYSSQNKALKKLFDTNDVLHVPGLRDLIFAYHGPEWVLYKKLTTGEWFTLFRGGYSPVVSLEFNNDKTKLTAYVDDFTNNEAANLPRNKSIVWNIADGTYQKTAGRFSIGIPWGWPHTEHDSKIVAESADGQFRANLVNPDMFGTFVASNHTVTIDADVKLALLKAIITADPNRDSDEQEDDSYLNSSIQMVRAIGLGKMFGASLGAISGRKK